MKSISFKGLFAYAVFIILRMQAITLTLSLCVFHGNMNVAQWIFMVIILLCLVLAAARAYASVFQFPSFKYVTEMQDYCATFKQYHTLSPTYEVILLIISIGLWLFTAIACQFIYTDSVAILETGFTDSIYVVILLGGPSPFTFESVTHIWQAALISTGETMEFIPTFGVSLLLTFFLLISLAGSAVLGYMRTFNNLPSRIQKDWERQKGRI